MPIAILNPGVGNMDQKVPTATPRAKEWGDWGLRQTLLTLMRMAFIKLIVSQLKRLKKYPQVIEYQIFCVMSLWGTFLF